MSVNLKHFVDAVLEDDKITLTYWLDVYRYINLIVTIRDYNVTQSGEVNNVRLNRSVILESNNPNLVKWFLDQKEYDQLFGIISECLEEQLEEEVEEMSAEEYYKMKF